MAFVPVKWPATPGVKRGCGRHRSPDPANAGERKAVLAEGSATLEDVVKVTVFVAESGITSPSTRCGGEYFKSPYPASTMVEVSALVNLDLR